MEKEKSNSYVYFALKGDDFDPQIITQYLEIVPTNSWRKGDKGTYKPRMDFSSWELSTEKGQEPILIDKLVTNIVNALFDKIETINKLKKEMNLNSVLEIVMDIDMNEEMSTPALGHDLKTIEFLYKTQTITDVDIYRFNSANNEN